MFPWFPLLMWLAIVYFAVLLWKKPHNLGYPSMAALIVLTGVWILIDQGKLNKYRLQMGDKVYQVSSSDFQTFFETNINDIGLALVNVYEKYYMVETIDLRKDMDKWKFIRKNGKTFLALKLQYEPVVKTINARSSGQLILSLSKEDSYEGGYYYTVLIEKEEPETNMEKRIIQAIQDGEVLFEVKYLRKVTENISTLEEQ